ncbi:hypothetical protein TRFO_27945 [Tritrichomonas foetus]|uniref:Leucine Rich Repeat family protein n=1 Tax=Tritrichomonas foetus TaxID=1144522 RepID=A0A1J4K475_9EUKA|nr:hypothetical protein TRFO_27945 [Tritrichomonas foetus]|eukprot:OHT04556.1 hypothetical protein TRFO_27945 [Tritrichomonas foetus]
MSIDLNVQDLLKDFIDIYIERPLVCQWVDKFNKKKHKNKRILCVSEFSFYLFEMKTLKKKIIISKKYRLFEMTKFQMAADFSELFFGFKSSDYFSICHPEIDDIGRIIHTHLYSIMKENELPSIDFPVVSKCTSINNPAVRFISLAYHDINQISHGGNDFLRNYFESNPTEFVASHFRNFIPEFTLLLSCVECIPTCVNLVMDCEISDYLAKSLAEIILHNISFYEIEFSAAIKGNLKEFADNLIKNKSNPLTSMKFFNSPIDSKVIGPIVTIIENHSLESLHISGCFKENTAKQFFTKIENVQKFREIPEIDFSNSQKIYADDICPLLSNVKYLNLSNCKLEICPFLEGLIHFNVLNIETIDLSKNYGMEPFRSFKALPKTLKNIVIDEISWDAESFIDAFPKILAHNPEDSSGSTVHNDSKSTIFELSIANTSLHASTWQKLIECLCSIESCKLTSLNWKNNTINTAFFDWINELKLLHSINLTGCFKSNPQLLVSICYFIEHTTSLKEFILDAEGSCEIGQREGSAVIDSLQKNYSLEYISLKKQPLGNDNIRKLTEALMINRRISRLDFDFLGCTDQSALLNFFQTLSNRGTPLVIKYPETIATSMEQNHLLTDENILTLKSSHTAVYIGNKKIKPPKQSITFASIEGLFPDEEGILRKVGYSKDNTEEKGKTKDSAGFEMENGFSKAPNLSSSPSSTPSYSINQQVPYSNLASLEQNRMTPMREHNIYSSDNNSSLPPPISLSYSSNQNFMQSSNLGQNQMFSSPNYLPPPPSTHQNYKLPPLPVNTELPPIEKTIDTNPIKNEIPKFIPNTYIPSIIPSLSPSEAYRTPTQSQQKNSFNVPTQHTTHYLR